MLISVFQTMACSPHGLISTLPEVIHCFPNLSSMSLETNFIVRNSSGDSVVLWQPVVHSSVSHIIFSLVFSFYCILVIERVCIATDEKSNLIIHAMKGFAPLVPYKVLDTSLLPKAPRFGKAAAPSPWALSSPGSCSPLAAEEGFLLSTR